MNDFNEELNKLSGADTEDAQPQIRHELPWLVIKYFEGHQGDPANLSPIFEVDVDWDRLNWTTARKAGSKYIKEIRRQWEERNPHKPANLDPEEYANKLSVEAREKLKKWQEEGSVFFGKQGEIVVSTSEGTAVVVYPEDYAFSALDSVRERTNLEILVDDLGLDKTDAEQFLKITKQLASINSEEKIVTVSK